MAILLPTLHALHHHQHHQQQHHPPSFCVPHTVLPHTVLPHTVLPHHVRRIANTLPRAAVSTDSGTDESPHLAAPPISSAEAPSNELVQAVHSPEDMQHMLHTNPDRLLIVMCKAKGCRPCKAFGRKYARLAEQYPDCVFAEIIGDESTVTRKMMIEWQIRSTPTFLYWRGGELMGQHTGINEDKFRSSIAPHLLPQEAGYAAAEEAA